MNVIKFQCYNCGFVITLVITFTGLTLDLIILIEKFILYKSQLGYVKDLNGFRPVLTSITFAPEN
jgi:hypothetical protein